MTAVLEMKTAGGASAAGRTASNGSGGGRDGGGNEGKVGAMAIFLSFDMRVKRTDKIQKVADDGGLKRDGGSIMKDCMSVQSCFRAPCPDQVWIQTERVVTSIRDTNCLPND